jgi:hypothetical protein
MTSRLFREIENLERKHASDKKRLGQLADVRRRIREEVETHGAPPPDEMVRSLLRMIDAGTLPPVKAVRAAVEQASRRVTGRLTLLDDYVGQICQRVFNPSEKAVNVAYDAIGAAIVRGILTSRRDSAAAQKLIPLGPIIEPFTGERDETTERFLDYYTSPEFVAYLRGRLSEMGRPAAELVIEVYESTDSLLAEIDQLPRLGEVDLTLLVRRALVFGLLVGRDHPTFADRFLREVEARR